MGSLQCKNSQLIMKKLLFLVLSICSTSFLFAQMDNMGTLSGKVIEADSGFEVIGGNVVLIGADKGTVTDFDGTYQLEAPVGTYTLEVSYIGFATQQITDVVIKAGEVVSLDVQLGESAIEIEGVEVVAKAFRHSETAVLALQKAAPVVLDGISAAQISKSGDSDVAGAIKRVPGVTVEGGKYVYVRGLGDRYSKTTLNRAEIPGLDPNRNTVQMDLFPTNLIDNILVYKTFSPNLPGDFTGGYIDIATKDFPEQFTLNASASVGYNSLANLNSEVLSYNGGQNDWIGFDDGTRALPEGIDQNGDNIISFNPSTNTRSEAETLIAQTQSFDNTWSMYEEMKPVNYGLSLSVGNQKNLFGKPLGMIAAFSYNRTYTAYENGQIGIHELNGIYDEVNRLNTQISLNSQRGQEETLWGAMFSSSLKLNSNNKVSLMLMHNQSGTSTALYAEGRKFRDDPSDIFQTRTLRYLERGLSTAQLSGKHILSESLKLEMDWITSFALSTQSDPDLRFFTNRVSSISGNSFIKPSSDNVPTRFYRDMSQSNVDTKVDFSLPFKQWNGLSSKLKFGAAYVVKNRVFNETRFNFNNQSLLVGSANGETGSLDPFLAPEMYFQPENVIGLNPDGTYANDAEGIFVVENYDPRNSYDAFQSVGAAYVMSELPITDRLRAIVGVRAEQTIIRLETYDTGITLTKYPSLDGEQDLINQLSLLPSLNLNYELTEKTKLRAAYSRTLARPSFRELAPFASFDLDGGFILVGNPDLQQTLVDNIDLRWEAYPKSGEIISLSAFYKNFTNPIERTFNPEAVNGELTLRNVESARLLGAEIELRKKLDFVNALRHFSFGGNVSYIYSQTDIDDQELAQIRASQPDAEGTREMYGQAPYSLNVLLSYKNDSQTSANLSYNVVGKRISVVTQGATPNYYLMPFNSLNFNITQALGETVQLKLSANNLLDAKYREEVEFKGESYAVNTYEVGRTFSVGVSFGLR